MIRLKELHAREVLDSRGNPTVEVVALGPKFEASAIVPSGASTGSHEALELRDGDQKRYSGKGVLKAVNNIDTYIYKGLRGFDVGDQRGLDEKLIELDGTQNKSRLGANAILGVSLACAKLAALEKGIPLFTHINETAQKNAAKKMQATELPVPLMNIMNGGMHADSGLEFQEMMIVPAGFKSFREALRCGAEIFHTLKKILHDKGLPTSVGDEGGFAPRVGSHEKALDLIVEAIEKAKYHPGRDVFLALDTASSEFYQPTSENSAGGQYHLSIRGKKKKVPGEELVDYFESLAKHYPIISIEDGLAEDDWKNWSLLTEKLGKKIQLVGDDLFVTNSKRLETGIKNGIANAILIKLNQIGTLTETLDVMKMARKNSYRNIVSHRSGESEDTTIAHLAVGVGAGQIKTGSLSRTDRVAKYNELLRIEEMLGEKAIFSGMKIFS